MKKIFLELVEFIKAAKSGARNPFRAALANTRGGTLRLIAVVPAYDDLTISLHSLLKKNIEAQADHSLLGAAASKEALDKVFSAHRKAFVVFCGHGFTQALATAPDLGEHPHLYNEKHSEIFNKESVAACDELTLFAYACNSGKRLGPSIEQRGGVFIGFSDMIPFPWNSLSGMKISPLFQEPVALVMDDFKRRGTIDSHTRDSLRAWYTREISRSKARRDKYATLHRNILRWHLDEFYR